MCCFSVDKVAAAKAEEQLAAGLSINKDAAQSLETMKRRRASGGKAQASLYDRIAIAKQAMKDISNGKPVDEETKKTVSWVGEYPALSNALEALSAGYGGDALESEAETSARFRQ